ncbi:MAG: WecB/TagA/CpsF family glycosyltransferase [Drouetiella hepatica Uher 2000/2452]|jgi:N-acetylglucosaminyldiphosphoundecaprenol N-acetyl-beta-D-mannosaminyltransferase|uniref:WecB/TagA/CpsF family glycosyltransferase n=1 Tax=Drouetiella hepatica Uher 2000/2452 TaxID=904376 RepID=A0A951Q8K5_9CYAN|nr:WecB/TagA/CpsF family glycosyltransferase [Drouetiella hepatica Uher 2000/2452]
MIKSQKLNSITSFEHQYIVGSRVDVTSYQDATQKILQWAKARTSAYVCAANVHMLMEAHDNIAFAHVVNRAALVTPDGMPLVWALSALGVKKASRVYGPTLTLHVCEAASQQGVPIGLYGGTSESLTAFASFLCQKFPSIQIACQIAPPFRSLTPEEDYQYTTEIRNSGAKILLVGIGCPKQEIWMHQHQDQLQLVMLGVGAAFDFHSGRIKQAPTLLQNIGLEWMFRLFMEPKRLWKRYFKHNPRFIIFFAWQWLTSYLKLAYRRND